MSRALWLGGLVLWPVLAQAQSYPSPPLYNTVATPSAPVAPVTNAYFVSTTGSDTAAGTYSAPFATLAHCLSQMEASAVNKTCYFLTGTYSLTAGANLTTSDNNETLAAYPGATPIFSASSGGALTNILTLTGTQFFTIQGITFTGVTTVASNGAVNLTNAGNVRIIANTFTNDDTGIRLNGSSKVLVSGNTFGGTLTTSGVYLNSTGSSPPYTYNTGIVIDSNKCSGVVGGLYGYYTTTGCVFATGSVGLRVTHNYFHDVGGSAISLADANSLGNNNEVNLEFEVAYNKIVNANNNSSAADTGAMYVDGRSGLPIYGSIHDNYINDAIPSSTSNVIMGIYLDDFTSYVDVYNNVTNGGNFACELHGGEYNYLHNNVFDIGNTSATNLGVCIIQGETGGPITSMVGNVLALNILYSTASSLSGFNAWNFEGGSSSQATFYNTNVYYNTNGQTIGQTPESGAPVANPLFVNEAAGWYMFTSASTMQSAYGFQQINQPVIGLAPTTPVAP